MEKGYYPHVFIVSGPFTANGKTTIVSEALKRFPNGTKVISTTTRQPRPGEKDGRDYRFCDRKKFKRLVDDGKMLEYKMDELYVSDWYGTRKSDFARAAKKHQPVFMIVEIMGARDLRHLLPGCHLICITAPRAQLIKRLRDRGGSNNETIAERRRALEREEKLIASTAFDCTITNADGMLPEATQQFIAFVEQALEEMA